MLHISPIFQCAGLAVIVQPVFLLPDPVAPRFDSLITILSQEKIK
jgi:hypothetical protein